MEHASLKNINVVHIDETTCSMKLFQQQARAAINRNVESKQMLTDEPHIAILMAASLNKGVFEYMIKKNLFIAMTSLTFRRTFASK